MAKLSSGVRLLRSLARAGKVQQTALSRLLKASVPKAPKPGQPTKSAKSAKAPKPPLATIRQNTRPDVRIAPGKWLAAQFPIPAEAVHGAGISRRMSYWLYLPQQVPEKVAREGWPLVVMLHGCHQSATQFAQGTRMNLLAEDKGYAVLYPQQPLSVHAQRCWRWYEKDVQHGSDETAWLAALIEKASSQHPIDRRRIYACGISAGAGMAAVLALNHPEMIAAVGLHSGPVFGSGHSPMGALHVMRHGAAAHADAAIHRLVQHRIARAMPVMPAMPAIFIQGDDDQVVRAVNQQQLTRQWLQLNGLPAASPARTTSKPAGRAGSRNAHEIRDYLVGHKPLLRVASIEGLGHAWSGGDPALKFNAQAGPDASRMMLDFFGRHRR